MLICTLFVLAEFSWLTNGSDGVDCSGCFVDATEANFIDTLNKCILSGVGVSFLWQHFLSMPGQSPLSC